MYTKCLHSETRRKSSLERPRRRSKDNMKLRDASSGNMAPEYVTSRSTFPVSRNMLHTSLSILSTGLHQITCNERVGIFLGLSAGV
jgi:hypothetical protein